MSKILHSGGVNAVKNILIQMGEEATEESASYFLNYVADLAANDPDAKFSLAELTQSAAAARSAVWCLVRRVRSVRGPLWIRSA